MTTKKAEIDYGPLFLFGAAIIVGAGVYGGVALYRRMRNQREAPPSQPPTSSGEQPPVTAALTRPADAPALTDTSTYTFDSGVPSGTDLWVDTRLPGDAWYGWTYVGRFQTSLEVPEGSYFPQTVSAESKIVAWLQEHAVDQSGAWSTAEYDPTAGYFHVLYGLYGNDVNAELGQPIATYTSAGNLRPGYG